MSPIIPYYYLIHARYCFRELEVTSRMYLGGDSGVHDDLTRGFWELSTFATTMQELLCVR